MSDFESYLATALDHAVRRADEGTDHGELDGVVALCAAGVSENFRRLQPERFLVQLLWCIGSQQKDYEVRMRARPGGSHWKRQRRLFRQGVPSRIAAQADSIREEHAADKRYLRPAWVEALIAEARHIVDEEWPGYRSRVLPLPADPESERLDAWYPTVRALDRLPWVGEITAWYLLRNLLGAPVFKPDIHIVAIAWHYFGDDDDPLAAMTEATRQAWPRVCEAAGVAKRVLSPHLGVVDFILWWYRRETGLPLADAVHSPLGSC